MIPQYYLDITRFDGTDHYCPDCNDRMINIHPFRDSTGPRDYFKWACTKCRFGVYHTELKDNSDLASTFIEMQFEYQEDYTELVNVFYEKKIKIEKHLIEKDDPDDPQAGMFPIGPIHTLELPFARLDYSDLPALHRKFQLYMTLS